MMLRYLLGMIVGLIPVNAAEIDPTTLQGKMLMGYQGWFGCPGDGSPVNGWHHWLRRDGSGSKPTIDMWPDTSGFAERELFDAPFTMADGKPAKLFSSHNRATVLRHFEWMKQYGIDGVFLQRFIGEVQDSRFKMFRNDVTAYVREGAELHGRVFAIEYDMAASQSELVKSDWIKLVDEMHLTDSKSYLRHNGKPVLALWGFGFKDRKGTAAEALALLNWLRKDAPQRYRATVVGGVPGMWRTGGGDSLPVEEWGAVYRAFDVISPWTVGRYANDAGADAWLRDKIIPDLSETKAAGIGYMPVVFPGFSWKNLHDGPFNQIPRKGGTFYWRQVANAISAGSVMMKTAMFDEVDEGTAMFKIAPSQKEVPAGLSMVTTDADGEPLPSDWYLRLGGAASKALRKEIPANAFPIKRSAE